MTTQDHPTKPSNLALRHAGGGREALSADQQGAEAEIRRLRAALKPFADLGVGSGPDEEHDPQAYRILRGAIRQARRALEQPQ